MTAMGVMCFAGSLRLTLVRVALVTCAGLLARLVGRRRDAMAGLSLAVMLLLLGDPGVAYDSGLMLAVCATTALIVFRSLVTQWLTPVAGRSLGRLLGASVAAQVGVAPLAATLFGGIPLYGPLVLAFSVPVVEVAYVLGLAGALATQANDRAGRVILWLAAQAGALTAAIWHFAAGLPGALIPTTALPAWSVVICLGAAAMLWLRWPTPRRAARVRIGAASALVVLLAFTALRSTGTVGLRVMDVGQGDAILIRDGGHAVLVDTGPDPAVLRQALARAGCASLDGVVLTHAHADHIGGVAGLAGVTRPAWIGIPDVVDSAVDSLERDVSSRAERVIRLRRDMVFDVGATHVRVLWPRGGERRLSANDTSVILLVERGGSLALLLGDAEQQAQSGALDAFAATVGMLKVAHHGSVNGNVPEALAAWRPQVALISVGMGNRFGHPADEALRTLASIGAAVHRTDLEGDLTWEWSGAPARSASVSTLGPLCDNRTRRRSLPNRAGFSRLVLLWPLPTSPISSPSISSTAPSNSCSSARRSACAIACPRSPISTSTWMCSTARPPPRMTS
jgi:competence protein ComEC